MVGTDKEALTAMLDTAGILWFATEGPDGHGAIQVDAGTGTKNIGYTGFCVIFYFNADGSLDKIGTWE